MKIAVVGAGLGGLAAAWLLGRAHAVTLFESQPQPGFAAAGVSLPQPDGSVQRVDVPLRVFYPGYYPSLTRLYQALAVPSEPVSYAASFANADGRLYFRYRNLRWGGRAVGLPAPQDLLLGARAWRITAAAWRFYRFALAALARGQLAGLSIGDYVVALRLAPDFVDGLLLPSIATVCTCTLGQARAFPAEVVVGYLAGGVASQAVHRALGGADDVQRRLLQGIPDLHCNARAVAVRRVESGVQLQLESGPPQHFDQLVLATPAHQALRLLADASADEAAMLGGFSYTPVQVLTHRDAALMPTRRRDWSPVNLATSPADDAAESTIWVNAVQPALRGAPDVFQTVHPLRQPRAGTVLGSAHFERPVVDARSQQALVLLQRLLAQPGRRLWFCGSYAQAGIPLLESAVGSAFTVAGRLGVALHGAGPPESPP